MNTLELKVGEWVEVKAKEEILATLDKHGRLDGLPFMPQMLEYCGQRFQVFKRAHKTCDTVNGCKGRKMNDAVHLLGIRCDGRAYSGCEASCLIFWKEAWLRRATEAKVTMPAGTLRPPQRVLLTDACQEEDIWAGTTVDPNPRNGKTIHACQATLLPDATQPLSAWDFRQYIEDYSSGNVGLWIMLCGFTYMAFQSVCNAGWHLGVPMRWLYDCFKALVGGVPYPHRTGKIPPGEATPDASLNLQAGEWVRIKTHQEILATLNTANKNRGLYFDAEMVPYCGKTFRVVKRITRILNEKTGEIMEFKKPCIMLEGVVCNGRYSNCRFFCPRAIYSYWREIWLERIPCPIEGLPNGDPVPEPANAVLEAVHCTGDPH